MTVHIRALGVPVRIETSGDDTAAIETAISDAWSACLSQPADDAIPYRVHFSTDATVEAPAGARIYRDRAALLDALSTGITQLVIDARSADLLMLHAAGLSDEHGRTIACVAASGTGKTTLARSSAGRFRYVTDETVGIDRDGGVVAYHKPLSVKGANPGPKTQQAPTSLGLVLSTEDPFPLRLSKIVLLDRIEDCPGMEILPVDELDAMTALVPQISYLSRLDRPLQRLAGIISWTGGVVRARYAEATDLAPGLHALLAEPGQTSRPTAALTDDEETTETLASWTMQSAQPVGERSSLRYRARPVTDWLVRGAECLVLCEQTVFRLSVIGAAMLAMTAHEPLTLDELTHRLVDLYGDPDGADSRTLARDALVSLISAGIVDEIGGVSDPFDAAGIIASSVRENTATTGS